MAGSPVAAAAWRALARAFPSNVVSSSRSSASGASKFKGKADLVLDLASVSVGGRQYALDTADLEQKGRDGVGVNKRTGLFTGGGAAVGAIIGAIAGPTSENPSN